MPALQDCTRGILQCVSRLHLELPKEEEDKLELEEVLEVLRQHWKPEVAVISSLQPAASCGIVTHASAVQGTKKDQIWPWQLSISGATCSGSILSLLPEGITSLELT
jgi:hypothetical protein